MNSTQIFAYALGLAKPWKVERIWYDHNKEEKILNIEIGYQRGYFQNDQGKSSVHDHKKRKWRHLNFFEHKCYIHCSVPRLKEGNKCRMVEVPWARSTSGFTLMFEGKCMLLIESEMPISRVAKYLGETSPRIWRIFDYWLSNSYQEADHSGIKNIGIDETSSKKGHNYVSIGVDHDNGNVFHAVPGKDAEAITKLAEYLSEKGSKPDQVTTISIDMSPAFISGCMSQFPNASIVFDRFHIKKHLNEAMDAVRKSEQRIHKEIKGFKYVFLKNNKKLSAKLKGERDHLVELYPKLGEAYKLKILFDDFYEMTDKEDAEGFLNYWCDRVVESGIHPFIKFTELIKKHYDGIISWLTKKVSNGLVEGINSKIQLAKRRARGYRNINNYINMIYLVAGKLKFNYPH